ncbi:hypothetical protein FS837_011270 [Tulasnella sp. UAMH 9824]|nr:hypothetical protein FS837_011270 [Tulasnella sp. UAMH 9824]
MRSNTSRRARPSRSQGTREHQPSAALTSSIPSTSQSSTTSVTDEPQSSTEAIPSWFQIGQAEAPNPLQHESDVPTDEKNDEQNMHPSPSSQSGEDIRQERFPNQLHKMIEDPRMAAYICWDGPDVFCVPNVEQFEKHALSLYFRRMQDWGSFHRQLSNYEFEKQDWGSGLFKFSHRHKKFRQGRKDLLREVVKPKQQTTSTPQVEVQAPPLIPYTPSFLGTVPPPSDQAAVTAKLSHLETMILELKAGGMQQSARESRLLAKEKQLLAKEKRLLTREKRLLARETLLFAREKRLAAKERQLEAKAKDLLARGRQLQKEFQLQELASEQPAISTQTVSPYAIDQTGSAGAAFDQDSEMCEGGEFHDAYDEITWSPEFGTTDGSNVQDAFSQLGTEAKLHIPGSAPALGQPLHPHSSLPTDPVTPLSSDPIPSPPFASDPQDSNEHQPGSPALDERVAACAPLYLYRQVYQQSLLKLQAVLAQGSLWFKYLFHHALARAGVRDRNTNLAFKRLRL